MHVASAVAVAAGGLVLVKMFSNQTTELKRHDGDNVITAS